MSLLRRRRPAIDRAGRRSALIAGVTSVLLAGCQGLRPAAPAEGLRYNGRLAVQVEGDASRSFSASFELQGRPESGWLALSNPLGAQIGRAEWSPRQPVLLHTPDETRRYPDLDTMAEDLTGEALPIAALFDWLAGRPWPARPHRQPDAAAAAFVQLGWRVQPEGLAERGLLVAVRDAPAPRVTVRAKLDTP